MLYPAKLYFKSKNKDILGEKIRESVANIPALQEIVKDVLQAEKNDNR